MSISAQYLLNKVIDMSLAECARQEIKLTESAIPGLMALREENSASKLLAYSRIEGCLQITIQVEDYSC
jgi:adenosylhomocysteinase